LRAAPSDRISAAVESVSIVVTPSPPSSTRAEMRRLETMLPT
jgi:hypothetical protein